MARRYYRSPGTIIKQTLAAWYIKENAGCGCNEICIEMDQDGPDAVERKLEYYTQKMQISITNWRKAQRWPVPQPPVSIIVALIQYGIDTSRQEELQYRSSC